MSKNIQPPVKMKLSARVSRTSKKKNCLSRKKGVYFICGFGGFSIFSYIYPFSPTPFQFYIKNSLFVKKYRDTHQNEAEREDVSNIKKKFVCRAKKCLFDLWVWWVLHFVPKNLLEVKIEKILKNLNFTCP